MSAIVFSGTSENIVFELASMNLSSPDAPFSVNVDRFSELAFASI